MQHHERILGLHPRWWALVMCVLIGAFITLTLAAFNDSFRSYVPVTVTSDRAGLVMEPGAKVKLRGVSVGRVAAVSAGPQSVRLSIEINSRQTEFIPANVDAQIKATTAFGAKYVDLIVPEHPSPARLSAGAVVMSRNVSSEVNTVFQNLVGLLDQIEPAKLNGVLSAVAEAVRGKGIAMGQAITATDEVLAALNDRNETVKQDVRSLTGFSDAYGRAAADILRVLEAAGVTSTTIADRAHALDALLVNVSGLADTGITLLGQSKADMIHAINVVEPTTNLLMKYNPEYTCLLVGTKWALDNSLDAIGGNGRSAIIDSSFILGDDPYRYPDNLPIVAAKGGPGGVPGCGSLPDATKNYPVRQLITNTGWGSGLDIRPNVGIGHPFWANYLPVTRGLLEPPSFRGEGPPAIGPVPYPGAPPYGAPLYGPDGSPLNGPPPSTPAGP
jgi:phospholipid/cholesterol/gamma-HCH transport system substrate-binding protein